MFVALRYEGIQNQVAADEGKNIASFKNKLLSECMDLCDKWEACKSFAYEPPKLPNCHSVHCQNCYLKDKILHGSEKTNYKLDWTTYYPKSVNGKYEDLILKPLSNITERVNRRFMLLHFFIV